MVHSKLNGDDVYTGFSVGSRADQNNSHGSTGGVMVTAQGIETGTHTSRDSIVRVIAHCNECNGTGRKTMKIAVIDLLRIYDQHPDNKIQRIKELRANTLLGLKSAKEVIEAYDKLLTELAEISYS